MGLAQPDPVRDAAGGFRSDARAPRSLERRGKSRLEILSHALFQECGDERDGLEPVAEYERAVAEIPPALPDRLRKIIAAPDVTPASLLTPADVELLERVGIIVSAALLLDGAE